MKLIKNKSILLKISIIVFVLLLVIFIFFEIKNRNKTIINKTEIICTLKDEIYRYRFEYNQNDKILVLGGDAFIAENTNVNNISDASNAIKDVEKWFSDNGGNCELIKN